MVICCFISLPDFRAQPIHYVMKKHHRILVAGSKVRLSLSKMYVNIIILGLRFMHADKE